MKTRDTVHYLSLMLVTAMAASPLLAQDRTLGPSIQHTPVKVAARGRPLGVTARVTPRGAPVKRVTLYYTPSRDVSPNKVTMLPTGRGLYLGTLPSHHLTRGQEIWYYIEAIDTQDEWAESSWQRVVLGNDRDVENTQSTPPPATPVQPVDSGSQGLSTKTVVIGGAVVAGAAIAIAVAASSGGGGGGDSPPSDSSGDCSRSAVSGTWTGTNPSVAPGFVLNPDGSAVFFDAQNPVPDRGSWGLIDCVLTLAPLSNQVYRGAGNVSSDQSHVNINGNGFTK